MREASSIKGKRMNKLRCDECGGDHEISHIRADCMRYWKRRAVHAENQVSGHSAYGGQLALELRSWLDQQTITSKNIGIIRRSLFVPWGSSWNALVRDETAERENKPPNADTRGGERPAPYFESSEWHLSNGTRCEDSNE
jgi:hypothetical protein